jgi:hypothetical protein
MAKKPKKEPSEAEKIIGGWLFQAGVNFSDPAFDLKTFLQQMRETQRLAAVTAGLDPQTLEAVETAAAK